MRPSQNCSQIRFPMVLFAIAFLMLTVVASQVSAQTTYTLGGTNVSGFTGPYGTATVTLTDPTHATVTFTTNLGATNAYLIGDGGAVAVNVNASSFTLSNITTANNLPNGSGFTVPSPAQGPAGNEDGFGSFNATVNNGDGFPSAVTTETFTLTNTSGTWANSGSVLVANSNGEFAAIHLFVCDASAANCTKDTGAIITGFASGGTGVVPEPASMLLFGSGLVALGAKLRRRKSRNSVTV